MGLLAMVILVISQRTKEIGIRKILGAASGSIVLLVAKDFLLLVLIGTLLATPAAWWAMHSWLDNFPYHISIAWWVFVGAGLAAVCIALVTVSFQAIRAALANPVKSLRSE